MVSRRGLLAAIGAFGGGGYLYVTNEEVKKRINEVSGGALQGIAGPPPTETMIGSVEGPKREQFDPEEGESTKQYTSLVKQIEFYESGAAKIYPVSDHGCYEAMAFRHEDTNLSLNSNGTTDTSDALATWSFGEFDEVLTVDMAGAIEKKSNYPNSTFVLQMVSDDGICISANSEVYFDVPESYIP